MSENGRALSSVDLTQTTEIANGTEKAVLLDKPNG